MTAADVIFIHSKLDEMGLPLAAFRVYAHLSRRADKNGHSWPGIDSIAATCQISRRGVINSLQTLEKCGMLRINRSTGATNSYQLTLMEDWQPVQNKERLPVQNEERTSAPDALPPCKMRNGTSAKCGTKGNPIEGNPIKGTLSLSFEDSVSEAPDDFETFWKAYPKKRAIGKARKAWKATARNRPPLSFILDAIRKASKSEQWQIPRFIPYPATWLNAHGWQDEHKPAINGFHKAGVPKLF